MLRRFRGGNLRHDAQEFLVASVGCLLFEAFEFEQPFLKGRCEQIVNRDVLRRRHFGGTARKSRALNVTIGDAVRTATS
jgi:hypothetical protein